MVRNTVFHVIRKCCFCTTRITNENTVLLFPGFTPKNMKKGTLFLVPFHDFQVVKNHQEMDRNNHYLVVRRPFGGSREMVHFGPLKKGVKKG